MNSDKIKLKQEKQNMKMVSKRMSFTNMIKNKTIDKIIDQLIKVDLEDIVDIAAIEKSTLDIALVSAIQLGKYDEKHIIERLIDAAKQVNVDTSKMVKSTMRDIDRDDLIYIVNRNLHNDNLNVSDRIWKSKAKLVMDIEDITIKHINQGGINRDRVARELSKRYDVELHRAATLVNNEVARVEYEVKDKVYMESDLVEELEFISMEDDRVTEICQGLHGTVWNKNDPSRPQIPSDTHIGCRSMYRVYNRKMDKYSFSK